MRGDGEKWTKTERSPRWPGRVGRSEIDTEQWEVKIKRPCQCGMVMYQLAKLRMLEFYSNFLDLNVKEFELFQIDMDIHKNIFLFLFNLHGIINLHVISRR